MEQLDNKAAAPRVQTNMGGFEQMELNKNVIKARKTRVRHSNFLITINPNKPFQDLDDPEFKKAVDKLQAVVSIMFDAGNLGKYIQYKEPGKGWDDVESITTQGMPEVGATTHMLHYHVVLECTHRTRIGIDHAAIRAEVKARLALAGGVHVNVKLVPQNLENVIDYVKKAAKK